MKQRIDKQAKDTREQTEGKVNCEREMRNELVPGTETRAAFWGIHFSDEFFIGICIAKHIPFPSAIYI